MPSTWYDNQRNRMKPYRNKTPGKNTVPKNRQGFVQKDPVEVYCRVRPLCNPNDVACLRAQSDRVLQLLPPDIFIQRNKDTVVSEYTFRFVFGDNSTQDQVFEKTALPLVEDLIRGQNGLLFTYGVTSSGKTFTMTGAPEETGILPRCLDVLFNSISRNQTLKFVFKPNKLNCFELQPKQDSILEQQHELFQPPQRTPKNRRRNQPEWNQRTVDKRQVQLPDPDNVFSVFVSFVEIYNNYIYDLLEEEPVDLACGKAPQSKILREDQAHNTFVYETIELEVKNSEEAFDVFWRGQQRRKVAHTALNTESSRSHSIFVIRLVQGSWDIRKDYVDVNAPLIISQLSLVDLAGSERTGRTRNTGNRLKETGNINNSLMNLRQCIEILREKQTNPIVAANKMVPYRDNKLTLLFKSFFEGEGRVRMIVCANPAVDEFDETLQAMKFAELTQEVLIPRQALRPLPPPRPLHLPHNMDAVLTLGPPIPDALLHYPDDVNTLKALEKALEARERCRPLAICTLLEKQADFREQLVRTNLENNVMQQQVRTLQMDLEHRVDQLAAAERKWAASEQKLDTVQKKVSELERSKRSLQGHLRERDMKINAGKVNQLRMETEMRDRMEMERDRMKRIMERRLAVKEAELQAKMCLSQERMRMLKEILNSGDDWGIGESDLPPTWLLASTSEPNLNQIKGMLPPAAPPALRDPVYRSDYQLERSRPPTRAGIPAANPRHRRSISAGCDKWIEHKPAGSVETGTIFQPKLKKKKSVSRLESKDMVEATKYVLTHQEQEATGHIKTSLIKGDIIPSSGGGTQTIFNDVEVLQQDSPPHGYSLRKRSAEGASVGADQIQSRVRVAQEHKSQGGLKKPRY